jgi:hypothetical protein
MGDSAGQFREAAERGNANLSKIMGTIAAAIKAQRQDLNDLQNVMQENESVSERNSSTLQAIQSELQDINSGIHDMATGIKNMARGIANVDNSIFRLNQDLQSSIGQSLLPGLLTGLSGTAMSIVKGIGALAMGGLAFGAGKTAMDFMTGGGAGGAGGGLGGAGGGVKQVSNPVMAKDIYSYLTKEKGIDHEHAVGMLANIQNESKFNSGAYNRNDVNGPSGGLFQHHDNLRTGEHRFTDMTRAAGPDWQKNWKGQIDYALTEGEMKSYLKTPVSSGQEAAAQFVYKFEKPRDQAGEASKRAGNVAAVEKAIVGGGGAGATKGASESGATPQSSPMQSKFEQPPVSSEGVSRVEKIGGEHGHGPISGAAEHNHNEKEAGIGKMPALPGGDIVALGRALQAQGIRVSEHPAFNGVHPEQHHPGSAHNDGLAIDINAPGSITEASDPVWGKRFDELAKQIQAAGYTVLWRTKGHDNHIHAQIGGKGIKGGQSIIGGQTTPGSEPSATTPGSSSPMMPTATPVAMTQAMPGAAAGLTPEQMTMMMTGMNPMAAAAASAMMGQLQSAQDEAAAIAPQQQAEQPQSQQLSSTQILEQLSRSTENTQTLKQAAVSNQVQQEIAQQEPISEILASIFGQQSGSSSTVVNNNSNVSAGGYNGTYDVGWPDWAEMIGGNHWKEMKNYKKNMWG